MFARRKNTGSVPGENPGSNSGDDVTPRVSTAEIVTFIKFEARKRTIKELERLTGLSVKQIEALRLGECGASSQTISTWARNDTAFRIRYFQFCGGYIETDPEFIVGISMAMNSLARERWQQQGGGE